MQNKRYIYFLVFIVSLGGFLFGFDAAVISGVNDFIKGEFELNALQLGWVVASVTISSAITMLFSGAISDAVGRKKILIVVALLYSISALLSALAPSYELLVLARLLGGIAFGAALVLVPLYIAETVPAEMRGSMVSINQLAIVIGFSAAYFSNYYLLQYSDSPTFMTTESGISNIWRWMLGIEAVPALLYFVLLFFIPNSPRWLMQKGKKEKAAAIITKINGAEKADIVMADVVKSLEEGQADKETKLGALFQSNMRLIMAVALIVGIAQMSVGINAVFFYATTIFELTGIGTNAAFAQAVWVGVINVLFTLIAIFLIDRLGRRPLLLVGLAGIAISLSVVAYGFSQATYQITPQHLTKISQNIDQDKLSSIVGKVYDNDIDFSVAIRGTVGESHISELTKIGGNLNPTLLLFGILGFVACFAFSLGPVMWVLLSEIFPNRIRGLAISVLGFINSMTSYVVVQFFPWQLENMGAAMTFMIYAGFATVAFFLLLRLLPETKGKTLEQIEKDLVRK